MVVKLLGNGSVTIVQEVELGTWEISTKINFAMINKINQRLNIFFNTFSVVEALERLVHYV